MRYYIGREVGYDMRAGEYVVYELKQLQCSKDHIRDVMVKRGAFITLDEATKFFRECYDGKIQPESARSSGVEVRKIK